ncbi:hypothetical protein ACJIZ3_006844 [Penstemon smallii]|uniref:Uncharacterized protein n=1 Tax=Penstemon smallii TaxID=265156 RepID=A0ABD3S8V4_9LAMI
MAKSKDDIKYGTAQAKVSEDESLRIRYKSGTPLEGGKIADSEPVHLFSAAHNIQKKQQLTDHDEKNIIAESEQPVDVFSTTAHPNIQKQN